MLPFIGRKEELQKLHELRHFKRVVLVVIKGRRRIGKTRLVSEFAEGKRFLSFTGLPPTDITSVQSQLGIFARQLSRNLELPEQTFDDWTNALYYLTDHLTQEPTIIVFDEISWMGSYDNDFVPKLKSWWDLELQKYPKLILIFSGSVSTWIEKNIINSTAFFGRITLQITLEELSLSECATLLRKSGLKRSNYDMFKILSITGGVPWYLEQISAGALADDNIKRLCFEKDGAFTIEFDKIFHDLFNGHGSMYKEIVYLLANGMKEIAEIKKACKSRTKVGVEDLLTNLIDAGFVTKHYSWSLKTEQLNKNYVYRLSDNYIRFFIKYIEPNLEKIKAGSYKATSLQSLPGWETMMGLQVENLLLNNRPTLLNALGINSADIVADNPYIQRATKQHPGCQIDYLIQMVTKNLLLCEFKFKRDEVGTGVIRSIKQKIECLDIPQGLGLVPVLFHFGGVTEGVDTAGYFYRIINISDFLENTD